MFETTVVPSFGGGLALDRHPAALRPDEWSFSDGVVPRGGCAEVDVGWVQQTFSPWAPAGEAILGLAPDPFVRSDILAVTRNSGTERVRLFQIETGFVSELTVSGTPPAAGFFDSPIQAAFLQGELVIALGNPNVGASLLRLDSTGTYRRITAIGLLRPRYVIATAGHLVAGYVGDTNTNDRRNLAVSDAGSITAWDPDIGNSADSFELSGAGEISGMCAWRDGGLVLTEERIYALQSTGAIPPFTVSIAEERGSGYAQAGAFQRIVATPYGVFYDGSDDVYALGAGGVGAAIYRYLRWNALSPSIIPKWLWHPRRGDLLVPTANNETLGYEPETRAWYRRSHPAGGFGAHEIGWPRFDGFEGLYWGLGSGDTMWREDDLDSPTPFPGAFVDTKDWAIGADPTRDGYWDRIRIDWEPLSNSATDAIEVLASVRNDFAPLVLGQYGMNLPLTFTSLGALAAGTSELPIRLRGKYARFRFRATSGRSRIRGFAIRAARGGDRVT